MGNGHSMAAPIGTAGRPRCPDLPGSRLTDRHLFDLGDPMDWFRYYHDALDDPKVQGLSGDLFKAWINLLSIASGAKPRGVLPSLDEIAFRLRLPSEAVATTWAVLVQVGLFDQDESGRWIPHNWESRQKKSDISTPRVRAHRKLKRSRNGRGNKIETPQRERKREKQEDFSQERNPLVSLDAERSPPSARSRAPLADGSLARSPPGGSPQPFQWPSDEELEKWSKDQPNPFR
jgi:hypothetical protein